MATPLRTPAAVHQSLRYRPEIDGLRAVAVLAVIFFHAGFAAFPGGFIGVDVFFVISGYLITRIILGELAAGTFSILTFYERRARRILPALFVVLAAAVPFAYLLMLPEELADFTNSLMATLGFVSNIYFWQTSDYFAEAAELKPLLHTWSLAVEEQFYVVFPLLLLLLRRLSRAQLIALLLLASALSLGVADWLTRIKPEAGFYLLPTRAWQLGVGALVACSDDAWSHLRGRLAVWGSTIGLALIVIAAMTFDRSFIIPGYWGTLPVLGTALIIACGRAGGWAVALLASRPFVWIGLISYSAYLWHQPIFAYLRMATYGNSTTAHFILAISATLALAYVSWRYVELPWRNKERLTRSQVFARSLAIGTALLVVAAVIPPRATGIAMPAPPRSPGSCHWLAEGGGTSCPYAEVAAASDRTVVLWGDSYADVLLPSLAAALQDDPHTALIPFIAHSCPSLLGTERHESHRTGRSFAGTCAAYLQSTKASLERLRPDVVILTSAYLPFARSVNPYDGQPVLRDPTDPTRAGPEVVADGLVRTVAFLKDIGSDVILLTPHPILDSFVHERRRQMLAGPLTAPYVVDDGEADALRDRMLDALAAADLDVTEVPVTDFFCEATNGSDTCSTYDADDGHLVTDGHHLSAAMATEMASRIETLTERLAF